MLTNIKSYIKYLMIAAVPLLLSFYCHAQDSDPYSDLIHLLNDNPKPAERQKQKVVDFGEYGEEILSTSTIIEVTDVDISSTLDFMSSNLSDEPTIPYDLFFNTYDYGDNTPPEITPDLRREDLAKFKRPVSGHLTSRYGYRPIYKRMHHGVDLKLNIGDTVRAALPGRVKLLAYNKGGYGYFMIITHANGLETLYGHLSGFIAKKGDLVSAGDPIAKGGTTGRSTGPHLHFETRYNGIPFDPNLLHPFTR